MSKAPRIIERWAKGGFGSSSSVRKQRVTLGLISKHPHEKSSQKGHGNWARGGSKPSRPSAPKTPEKSPYRNGDFEDEVNETSAEDYYKGFAEARAGKYGAFLSDFDQAHFEGKNIRTFTAYGGKVGGALTDHGDGRIEIGSLYALPGAPRGAGRDMLRFMIREQGGNWLNNFDGPLTEFYRAEGFEVQTRDKWNEEYAPDDWNYELFGRPDYVTMGRPGKVGKHDRRGQGQRAGLGKAAGALGREVRRGELRLSGGAVGVGASVGDGRSRGGPTEVAKARNKLLIGDDWSERIDFYSEFLTKRGESRFRRALEFAGGEGEIREKAIADIFKRAFASGGRSASVVVDHVIDFDPNHPRVVAWVEDNAATLIKNIDSDTRDVVKVILREGVHQGLTDDVLRKRIANVVGLDERRARALANFMSQQVRNGVPPGRVDRLAKRYRQRLLEERADAILRTEIQKAVEAGKLEFWLQAADAGIIKRGDTWRKWVVHEDERLCPHCRPMEGKRARLGGQFQGPLGKTTGPPYHVRCRCWTELEAPLNIDVANPIIKHASHDQSDHGNWSRFMPSKKRTPIRVQNAEFEVMWGGQDEKTLQEAREHVKSLSDEEVFELDQAWRAKIRERGGLPAGPISYSPKGFAQRAVEELEFSGRETRIMGEQIEAMMREYGDDWLGALVHWKSGRPMSEFKVKKHAGPGPHPSGSSQDAHAGGGGRPANFRDRSEFQASRRADTDRESIAGIRRMVDRMKANGAPRAIIRQAIRDRLKAERGTKSGNRSAFRRRQAILREFGFAKRLLREIEITKVLREISKHPHESSSQAGHGNWARGGAKRTTGAPDYTPLKDAKRRRAQKEEKKPEKEEKKRPEDKRTTDLTEEDLRHLSPEELKRRLEEVLKTELPGTNGMTVEERMNHIAEVSDVYTTEKDGVYTLGSDTMGKNGYITEDGDFMFNPEREDQHLDLLSEMEAQQGGDFAKDKEVVIMAGLPGAGKSTFLKSDEGKKLFQDVFGKDKGRFLTINADDVKEGMIGRGMASEVSHECSRCGGLKGMEHASLVHEESSWVAKNWEKFHMTEGTNLIMDVTALNERKTLERIQRFKDAGYKVMSIHMDVDVDTAKLSAVQRFARNSRPVPLGFIESARVSGSRDKLDDAWGAYRAASDFAHHYQSFPIQKKGFVKVED